jgi:hypothetical protein
MRSPALALAWQLWRRHRVGLPVLAVSWVALPVLDHLLIAAGVSPTAALPWMLEFMMVTLALVVMDFSFAIDADLALPGSSYPARLFTLPVPTRTLVVWPMLFGNVATAAFWASWTVGFVWPGGERFPWWPGFLVAAILAWVQAALWFPAPTAWVRLVALFVPILAVGSVSVVAFTHDVPEWAIALGLGCALLAAYGVALVGVRRARCGETPEWPWWSRLVEAVRRLLRGRRRTFASPGAALVWAVERPRRGWIVPVLIAWCLVPTLFLPSLEQAMALLASLPEHAGLAAAVRALSVPGVLLLSLLVVPPGMATLAGNDLGRLNLAGNTYAIAPFLATRPVSTATLVFAKLRLAAESTLGSWAIALPVALGWFVLGGKYAQAADSDFVRYWGSAGAGALLALLIVALVGLTWTQTVKGLWSGLAGRLWVATAGLLVGLTLGTAVVVVLVRLKEHPEWRAAFFVGASWLAGAAVVLKLAAAGWVLRVVSRRRLMPQGFPAVLVAGWTAAVAGLTGLLYVLVSGEWVPPHLLALGAILFVPLTRIAVAPLAVEWNRHR